MRLLEGRPETRLERDAWPAVRNAATQMCFVIIGEPGSGKSGLSYALAVDSQQVGTDPVFLPVDQLAVTSEAALRAELGITHNLADVPAHWPGRDGALLIVDALDAARSGATRSVFQTAIAEVTHLSEGRWRVVASVRTYDLRHGLGWPRLFAGPTPATEHANQEFKDVRHVAVGHLTDAEVSVLIPLPNDEIKLRSVSFNHEANAGAETRPTLSFR